MARIFWPDSVVRQLDDIVAYIHLSDPVAADRIGRDLFALGESLAYFPHRGRPAVHGTRELTGVPPYILQYDVVDDLVTILRVRHGARNPTSIDES